MSRKTHISRSKAIDLEFGVTAAINRYYEKHPIPSAERRQDIQGIKAILSHATYVAAQKHAIITRYVKTLHTGLLGRSDLRDYVLQALAAVPIEGLIKELLRHHKAELKSRDMKLNALHTPEASHVSPDLLLAAKETDLDELDRNNKNLKEKAARLASVNKQVIEKYRALKNTYVLLCRKYGEQYTLSSDVVSQCSDLVSEPIQVDCPSISEDHEEPMIASSSSFRSQHFFKLAPLSKEGSIQSTLSKSLQ